MELTETGLLVYGVGFLLALVFVVAYLAHIKWREHKELQDQHKRARQTVLEQTEARDRKFDKLERETFWWYRDTYPTCVSKGRVTCYSCGGRRLHTARLDHLIYWRRHFCVTCGTTLYYSPEDS